jgi:hemerythrin
MALIDWDERLFTGQATMDRDHKKITGLINQLAASVAANKSCERILTDLVHRTESHFAMEAKLMGRRRYPYAEAHLKDHESLLKDLRTFKTWFDAGSTPQYGSVLAFLEGWWTRHIVASDKALAQFLAAPKAPRAGPAPNLA